MLPLIQIDGGATSGFKASHGFLPLSLTTNASPSPSAPVTFNVSAQIPGFAPVSQTITITKDTATIADISAVEYANPPQGTGVLVHESALTNGVSNGTQLTIPAGVGMVESARVNIQEGTQMLDANSQPISASELTSGIVNYSATSPTSYGAFPGGFSPTNVIDADGKQFNDGFPQTEVFAGLFMGKIV